MPLAHKAHVPATLDSRFYRPTLVLPSMSQAPLENINMTEADIGPDAANPRSAQNQASQAESSFVDSSGPLFSMYMGMAEEEDMKLAESWKADADGILIFTGLFSAAVASLISVSIQDIQQNPQDTSNFYLANIYQAVADPNRPNISASLPTAPPPFSPPNYAVWVNSLWFMSLVISITCALLATLLQQWARRYLKVTRTRHSLHKRARLRSFFAEGVEKSLLPLAVEALPTLVHASLFLFFAGMVVFLWNVNLTVFKSVLSWISFCTVLYGCITLVPILRPDSPYYTPLTPIARLVIAAILCAIAVPSLCFGTMFFVFSLCSCCLGPYRIFGFLINWLDHVWDMTFLMPAEAALKSTSEIDTRALLWTFDRLDEDHELEHFFSGLPGFHSSKVVKEPLRGLRDDQKIQLSTAMVRLLDRTFSSDLLPDRVKHRRGDICANAIDLIDTPKAFPEILRRLASEDGYGPVNSAEIGRFLRRWDYREGEDTTVVQALFSIIVARVQRQDDSWFILASDLLGVPETDLRSHAAHSSDLSLAILIYITRQQLNYFQNPSWPLGAISDVLGAASKFKVQDTSPVLQHEFCALWNQVARKAQHDSNWAITNRILKPIRNVYLTLHHNTSSAPTRFNASTSEQDGILELESSYPVCNIVGHIHNNSASTAAAQTVLLDDAAWSPPSFPSPAAPFHADEILTTVPLLDDSHTIHQTLESFPIPATSPDQATSAGGIQHIVASSIMTPYPTPEISTSVHPRFFTSQPTAVSLQYSADPLTPSDSLNLPSPTSNPVLDNLPPRDSHLPIKVISAPSASQRQTFGPHPGTAAHDDDSPTPGIPKKKDALDPPSVNHTIDTNIVTTPDRPLQSPPPALATDSDVATTALSLREPNAEHTGDRPPGASRYQYDIV